MSKNVAVFVDVANLYYAARGQDVDVDYLALLKHATKGRDLIRAYAYSGLDPENENQRKFLEFLGKNGYKVVAKDIRKFGDGRVKANLDIELVVDLFRLADRMDIAVIVSGDGDFAPAIRALQDRGVRCEVVSFKPNTSSDLFAVADEFIDAMKISSIGRQRDAKGVGAPEMPAKEVNPEVGFREAPPSIAAAALAAIRGDGDAATTTRGRGRAASGRRERSARSPRTSRATRGSEPAPSASAPVAEPAELTPPAAPPSAADSGEPARRRRRRGGRGRGRRGRRGDAVEGPITTTAPELGEVQWQELESLEELEGIGLLGATVPAAVEFEEADAETLAELGLTAQPLPQVDEPAPAEAAAPAKPRARRGAKGEGESAEAPKTVRGRATAASKESAAAPAKPKRARGTKTAGMKATATKTAGTKAAATKTAKAPAPRARGRGAKRGADQPAEAGSAGNAPRDDEGIWKRFTSGRGSRRKPAAEGPAT